MSNQENQRQHDRNKQLMALAAAGLDANSEVERAESPNAAGPEIETMFGPYRLERSLGHGGQGIVYLAEDTRLGRKVALKLLSAQGAAGDTARARFEREATAASRLRHPGICTVYEAGEIDGSRFLAMEYVDGEGLPEWIARTAEGSASGDSGQRRTRVEQAFQLVERIARAVHAANQAGVVHRDIKPQNIMLRRDGSPVVLDFGLARDDSEQETLLTIQGDVLGTPAYMPPERVRGIAGSSADPREDVYGLGTVLYECLTGQRPFRGHTREQLYRHILTQPVDDPRKTDQTIPREARFVVETAMEKEPDRRYASALELADELLRLQKREPIRARPVPRWLRLVRWVQRNPAAAIPTIGAFGVLAAGIVTALLLLAEVGSEARHATIRALLAESALQLNRDPQRALLLAKEASDQLDQGAPPELRVAVRSQLVEVLAQTRLVTKFSHGDIMVGAGFSGDSQRVATVARGKNGPAVRLWSADGKREIANYAVPKSIDGNPDQLTCCAFDEDGARLLITPYGGVVRVVSLQDGRLLHELRPAKEEPAIIQFNHSLLRLAPGKLACFVPGQPDLVLTGSLDGARIWRLTPGQLQATELWHDPRPHTLAGRVDGVSQVAVSADGRTVAAGEHGGIVRVLRTEPAKNTHKPIVVGQQQAHQRPVHALVFDPKRPLLLTSARDEQIAVWSTEPAGSEEQEPKLARVGSLQLEGQNAIFLHVAPPSPGRRSVLAVLDDNRSVHLFRSTDAPPYFERYAHLQTHDTDVQTITFAPDGSRFGSGSIDGVARIFDLSGRLQKTLRGGSAFMSASAWSSGGESILVTGNNNGETHLWRDRDPVFRVEHLPGTIERLAAAGTRLAGVMRNGSILVVDLESDSVAIARPDTTDSINTRGTGNSFALRSDGMRLATGHNLGRLELWDLTGPVPRHEPPVSGLGRNNLRLDRLDFGADGTLFIAAGRHMRALSPGGTLRQIGELPGGRVTTAATRRGVAAIGVRAAMWDCEQQVLDKRGILLPDGMLRVHDQGVLPYASTSADGRWMVLHDWASQRIRVVDADAREPHRAWSVPGLRGAAIDADGRRVLTTGVHGSATLWDLSFDPPRQIVELRGHKGTVWAASFHPNGDELITAGSDGTVRFWPANFDGLEQLVKERLVRDWTEAEKARYAALLDR